MSLRRTSSFVTPVVLTLLLCGCSREIDRSTAADLISDSASFSKPLTFTLKEGSVPNAFDPMKPKRNSERTWQALAARGLISLTDQGLDPHVGGPPFVHRYELRLTPQGRTFFEVGLGDTWTVAVARKVVAEVTGIAKFTEDVARVEYTWRYEPIADHYEDFLPGLGLTTEQFAAPQRDTVTIRRYDDGWRLRS